MGARGPEADSQEIARITGVVARLAAGQRGDYDDAVDEVRTAAGGRADLLGIVAGTFRGRHRADPLEAWYAPVAERLCVDAGADVQVARDEADVVERRLRASPFGPASDPESRG